MRIFPLSSRTKFDVWDYVAAERIEVVPLYFAAPRLVLRRGAALIARDGEWLPLYPGEAVETPWVYFRTMGAWPLTGAHESRAVSPAQVTTEMRSARTSARQGKLIDNDKDASMECEKREGYFW